VSPTDPFRAAGLTLRARLTGRAFPVSGLDRSLCELLAWLVGQPEVKLTEDPCLIAGVGVPPSSRDVREPVKDAQLTLEESP
jgi:hypothetical protein